MTLAAGSRLGPYEIAAPIGAGGMGEVYRARDPRIGRDVAVKVLPAAFANNAERLLRFEREARSAGILNHPNILAIHDVGTHDGTAYVVSELLDGETLRDRLNLGALPVRKAIDLGIQIAHGLAAAHDHGIVHRDLKPENLFVTPDGRLKILDFGLAKLTHPDPVGTARATAPTLQADTGPGQVWGTVGYMSPEQARGNPVDHRSDIFSLGAILYEMLSGRRAFQGASPADTVSAILKEDPRDLTEVVETIPPALERVVRHCLEKSPAERFQSTRDLAFGLAEISGVSRAQVAPVGRPKFSLYARLGAAAVVLLALGGAVVALPRLLAPREVRAVMRLPVDLPSGSRLDINDIPVISPDGRVVVFPVADSSGPGSLWLRRLDSLTPQQIPGTRGASDPFWSPDSRSVGFFADGKLKSLSIDGGPIQVLCNAGSSRGGTWSKNDVILFAPGASGGLYRVDSGGGDPVPVTVPDSSRGETGHRYPFFLPDGAHYLFLSAPGRNGMHDVFVGSIASNKRKLVLRATRAPHYVAPGYLLFSQGELLMAQRFDLGRMETRGDAITIAEAPTSSNTIGCPVASASNTGTVMYRRETIGDTQLEWYDRHGNLISRIATPPEASRFGGPRVSPDGAQVALNVLDGSNTDIWVIDLRRGVSNRLTSDPGEETSPRWSPDGTRIVYTSDRLGGGSAFFVKSLRDGTDELLWRSPTPWKSVWDWSHDGRYVVFREIETTSGFDLWVLPMFGDRKPFPYLKTRFEEQQAAVAPTGNWMAYASDESGRFEIYVQTFPKPGDKHRVSVDGGFAPIWSRDGKELLYIHPGGRLMSVAIHADAGSIDVGAPRTLFTWPAEKFNLARGLDVAPDGRLLSALAKSDGATRIPTLILNWSELLKRKE